MEGTESTDNMYYLGKYDETTTLGKASPGPKLKQTDTVKAEFVEISPGSSTSPATSLLLQDRLHLDLCTPHSEHPPTYSSFHPTTVISHTNHKTILSLLLILHSPATLVAGTNTFNKKCKHKPLNINALYVYRSNESGVSTFQETMTVCGY